MKSLNAQFDSAMDQAFALHDQMIDKLADDLRKNRLQQKILNTLISDHRDKPDLIEYVLMRLEEGYFHEDENATAFFCRCADEIFLMNLTKHKKIKGDQYEKMKSLHPLWGTSWWTK